MCICVCDTSVCNACGDQKTSEHQGLEVQVDGSHPSIQQKCSEMSSCLIGERYLLLATHSSFLPFHGPLRHRVLSSLKIRNQNVWLHFNNWKRLSSSREESTCRVKQGQWFLFGFTALYLRSSLVNISV